MIFPTKNAPKFLTDFGSDIADVYSVPIEFAIVSLISAFSSAIGSKVVLKTDKYTNYSQFWFVIVAPSGTGKSEPLAVAYKPIEEYERAEFIRYKESVKEWRKQCFEAQKNQEPKPEKPKQKRITCSDTTPEALFELLSENSALTIYRDELAGHFHDIGRYSKSGEVAHYLSCFNNKQFSIDRKGSDMPIFISKPILSMIGTVQPEVMQSIANKNSMRENGYLQRCLFIYPDDVICSEYSQKALKQDLVFQHEKAINYLLNLTETMELKLSENAKQVYVSFHNEMATMANGTQDDYMKSLYSKMSIHTLRLSLILSVIDTFENDNPESEVSEKIMMYSVELCRYFIETGRKMYAPPPPPNLTTGDCYRHIHQAIGIKNQAMFAESLGLTQQAISKAISIIKT